MIRAEAVRPWAGAVLVLGLAACRGPEPIPDHPRVFEGSYETAAHAPAPWPIPDRIVLTWETDPATSQAVTWRTDTSAAHGTVEIAPADASPRFREALEIVEAETERVETDGGPAHFHSANVRDSRRPLATPIGSDPGRRGA